MEKLKSADELFNLDKFEEAYTLYLQLLPNNRLDPDINFKYGTCLLMTTDQKKDALPYLNFAASKNADPRVHFFLGKTYHLLYKFGEAQKHYQNFKAKGTPTDLKKYDADLHIKMCQNGKKLLANLTEMVVEAKIETKLDKFPYSYDLSQMGGRIIISEEFQSKYDAKIGFRSMTYIPPIGQGQDVLFYSSYGKDGSTGLDLYAKRRLPNGDWGEEQKLPAHINTPYDDAYGFLHSSQTVFYFCSKGHNSMGGYDVFKCSYDLSTNSFGPPVNLDYKINTPDDDIMYVVDSLEENAYFASSRATKAGSIDVYKVRVETFPIINVLLAGNFDNKINAEDQATIKIQDTQSDEIIGIYNPTKDGKYTIILPKSGSYNFIVETEQSEKIHTSPVVIPPQKEFKPLKQKIILSKEDGTEKLIIQNLFDEQFSAEESEQLLADAMQSLADPDVNAGQFDNSLTNEDVEAVLENGDNVRLEDLVSMSETMYKDAQAEADQIKERMEAAYAVADAKGREAAENAKNAEELLATLDEIDNPLERQQQAALADELNQKAKDQYIQATTAYNLANALQSQYDNYQKEADENKLTFESIKKAVEEEDHDNAVAQLKVLKDRLENIISNTSEAETGTEELVARAKKTKEDALKEFDNASEFRAEEQKLNLRLNNLQKDYEKASEKDKPAFKVQMDELEEQIAMNKKWGDEAYAKAEQLDKEADALSHQVQLLEDLAYDIENGNTTALSDDQKATLASFMDSKELEDGINNNENVIKNSIASNTTDGNPEITSANGSNTGDTTNNGTNNPENTNNGTDEVVSDGVKETILTIGTEVAQFDRSEETTTIQNDPNLSAKEKATQQNEVYENWIADYSEKIQEIEAEIDGTDNPAEKREFEKIKEELAEEKSKLEEKVQTNESLIASENSSNQNTSSDGGTSTVVAELSDAVKVFDKTEELAAIENNNALSEEEKLTQKNAILADWVDKYDYKIVEVNKAILESSDAEERNALMKLRNEFEDTRDGLENDIQENEIALNSTPTVQEDQELSQEYKDLLNETKSELAQPEDFTNSISEEPSYKSSEATNIANQQSDTRSELNIKEQEKAALELSLEAETKEKKQQKIQEEIDQKDEQILEAKSTLATSLIESDALELEHNDEQLAEVIEAVKNSVTDYATDENYLKAKYFNDIAEEQRKEADAKIDAADKATSSEEKTALLEEAHALNAAAIDNQRSTLVYVEDMNVDGYQAKTIPTTNDNSLADGGTTNNGTTDPENTNGGGDNPLTNNGTDTNSGGTTDNGTTDPENTNGGGDNPLTNNGTDTNNGGTTNNGTTDPENTNGGGDNPLTNNGVNSNNTGSTNATGGNSSVQPTLENLNQGTVSTEVVLDKAKEEGIKTVTDQTVNEKTYQASNDNPDAYEVATEVEDITYSGKYTEFENSSAPEILAGNEKSVEKIEEYTVEKQTLNAQAQNAQTDKEKSKIESKVVQIDKKIGKEELKMSDDIASITEAEVTAARNNLQVVKQGFEGVEIQENTSLKQSQEYEEKANFLSDEVLSLREEAANEKDKTKKNELLKDASSKEHAAANYYDRAADYFVEAAFESGKKTIETSPGSLSSDDLENKATDAMMKSSDLMKESIAARDSALLAKGDEKIELLNRADEKEKQANTFQEVSNNFGALAEEQRQIEKETSEKETLLAGLNPEDAQAVKENEVYPEYFNQANAINEARIQQSKLEGEQEGIENILLQQNQDLQGLRIESKNASKDDKIALENQIETLEDQIDENEDRLYQINEMLEAINVKITNLQNTQSELISSMDPNTQDDFEALSLSSYDKNPIEKKTSITFDDLISSGFIVPKKVESNIIAIDQTIQYSDSNPIPLDPDYPDGLIYKVQVGAFSKPIPNDVFSGFAPISGEKVGNLIRYRVGYFVTYSTANDAKNQIRGMGYSDAFVVAIYNGERISLADARNLEQNAGTSDLANNNAGTNTTNNGGDQATNTNGGNQNGTNGGNEVATNNGGTANNGGATNNGSTSDVEVNLGNGAAVTNNADKIEGLFYTVQLGAFSNPIKATDVYNISPLVTKFVGSLYKYSTGIYRSVEDAIVRKNEVVALGNTDAFVTVYYNGERISVAKAKELIDAQGESIFATNTSGQLKQLGTTSSQTNTEPSTPVESEKGRYQVVLGIYSGEMPVELANAMLMIPQYEIKTDKVGTGEKYFVGNFNTLEDAQNVVDLYRDNGVDELSIVDLETTVSTGPKPVSGLVYKVFLGTYEGEVPASRGITFVELKDEGVVKEEQDGKQTYYAGEKGLFKDAEVTLKKFTSRGVSIAEIKSFRDGVEIPVSEAKALTGE